MALTCTKCNKNVTSRRLKLICSVCTQIYHVECSGYSTTLFELMDKERKLTWKCRTCCAQKNMKSETSTKIKTTISLRKKPLHKTNITDNNDISSGTTSSSNQNLPSASTPRLEIENEPATVKVNVPTENSFQALSDESYNSLYSIAGDTLNRSCPDMRTNNSLIIQELRAKVENLDNKLGSADDQIEILLSENYKLQEKNNEYKKQIAYLTKICRTPSRLPKNTSLKTLQNTQISPISVCDSGSTGRPSHKSSTKKLSKPTAQKKLSLEVDVNLEQSNIPCKSVKQFEYNTIEKQKPNMCIISSEKKNSILKAAFSTFCDFKICHYCTPNGDTKQLINGIDKKLKTFTMDDYCVIFLGESDFIETRNYTELVEFIRLELLKVQNTNIIICVPTFKLNPHALLYNKRIETFNKILDNSNLIHKYVYILDSNKNLDYTTKNFDIRDGILNNKGLIVIFNDLKKFMKLFDIPCKLFDCNLSGGAERNSSNSKVDKCTQTELSTVGNPDQLFRV